MKVIAIIEKPENCFYCDMLNGSDECILQDKYQNFDADSLSDLLNNCPLRELPEAKSEECGQTIVNSARAEGWNACLREITGNFKKNGS